MTLVPLIRLLKFWVIINSHWNDYCFGGVCVWKTQPERELKLFMKTQLPRRSKMRNYHTLRHAQANGFRSRPFIPSLVSTMRDTGNQKNHSTQKRCKCMGFTWSPIVVTDENSSLHPNILGNQTLWHIMSFIWVKYNFIEGCSSRGVVASTENRTDTSFATVSTEGKPSFRDTTMNLIAEGVPSPKNQNNDKSKNHPTQYGLRSRILSMFFLGWCWRHLCWSLWGHWGRCHARLRSGLFGGGFGGGSYIWSGLATDRVFDNGTTNKDDRVVFA